MKQLTTLKAKIPKRLVILKKFSNETGTKRRQFVYDEVLTSRPLTEEPGN